MDSGRFENMVNSPTTTSTTATTNTISQSLASILNNPHAAKYEPEFAPLPPPPKPGSDISRPDFTSYLSSISEPYSRFHHIQQHEKFSSIEGQDGNSTAGQGEALVACLREVPAFYFEEEFKLEEGAMSYRASENLVLQERLSQYLDVVELHLVKEISLRSSSFFEAQGQLEELNSMIVQGCSRIRELKETIRLLESGLVGSANKVQGLSKRRNDLITLQNKLHLILYVNQALSALKLLVASADCAGALDVIDDLQHLLEGDELTGLHCFRHLRDHVATSTESINSILSAEFLRASIRDAGGIDASLISKFKESATVASSGKDDEVKLDEEEIGSFRDRLLPLVIGLLRTAKLPGALRVYRETLTGDMKIAIKTTVEVLLPVLVVQPLESDFIPGERMVEADGGGSSLATRLRSLPAESFVHLLRAVFAIVRAHLLRASEVKKAIEWILSNPDGHYAADSVAAALTLGAAAAESAQETGQFSSILPSPSQRNAGRVHSVQGRGNDATSPSNLSRNFRADVLRENAEAVFAGCDAAHGRWAKLLGVRAIIHPKLRLPEFLSIFNITQEFISTTEKIGGRLGYSIRGTLQSQAKAFVDFQHESRMAKMRALLDQENWAEVDVPDEFQAIVALLIPLESSDSGNIVEASGNNGADYNEGILSSGSPQLAENGLSNSPQPIEQNNHPVTHVDGANQGNSSHSVRSSESNNAEPETSSAQHTDVNMRERTKTSIRTLSFGGNEYHMVNCGLILLKMLSDYIDMNNCLPTLSSEVVHRVVEILKFFNTRTAQLVLGAGAMQVSGLRSITSKNLALASQVVSFIYAIIPDVRRILFVKVPETRRGMLSSEIDRVAQDYKVHRDEIHSKLVQIMRERLVVHLRGLPQIVESWNRPDDTDTQPSQFARSLTKEVNFLQRVLSRTLHEVDVQAIFRQVAIIFHSQISEAFSPLDINTPQAKIRLYRDIQHILGCIRSLPSDNPSKSNPPNWGQLDEFLLQRFGAEAGQ